MNESESEFLYMCTHTHTPYETASYAWETFMRAVNGRPDLYPKVDRILKPYNLQLNSYKDNDFKFLRFIVIANMTMLQRQHIEKRPPYSGDSRVTLLTEDMELPNV
jgi:hypothetical protein